ncbi:sterile alpha motif domain-containing protein 5-like isoform X2 [Biomphalaria glabrata]
MLLLFCLARLYEQLLCLVQCDLTSHVFIVCEGMQDQSVCGSSLTALAIRFAEELKTHFIDVLERLEELWIVARNNESLCSSLCRSPARGVYGGPQSIHYGYPPQYYQHIYPYPGSPRSQPPPLPSCPPPPTMSSNCMDRCSSLQSHLDGGHLSTEILKFQSSPRASAPD